MDSSLFSLLNGDTLTVVIDVGAFSTSFGFAGDPAPTTTLTCLKTLNGECLSLPFAAGSYPIEKLEEALFLFLQQIIVGDLLCNPKEIRVALCENIYATRTWREAVASALLTRLQVISIVFIPHQPAAVLAIPHHTALIVDVGHSGITVVPVYHRVVLRRALASFPSAGLHVLDRISTLMKEYPAQVDVESSIQLRDEVLQTLETEVEESTLHSILTDYLPRQEFLPDIIRLSEPSPRKRVVHLRKEVLLHATDPLFECDEDHRNVAHTILDCLLQCNADTRLQLVCRMLLIGGGCNLPNFRKKLVMMMQEAIEIGPRKYTTLTHLKDKIGFTDSQLPAASLGWVGASLISSNDSLIRSEEIHRQALLGVKDIPDWTSLLHPETKSTLFKAPEIGSGLPSL